MEISIKMAVEKHFLQRAAARRCDDVILVDAKMLFFI